ncbi:MAG TPA: four-helix bundle copper-binding protein [Tepidisphaeraceae bacterium]|jgi:hypothetical protein|nr:four-helix bundle copper-binding protein [Tepidisphaeraceae bacterium]
MEHEMTSDDMQQCIQNCRDCQRICMLTLTHCFARGGEMAEATHLRLLMDCAEMCQTSANFMLRVSDLHPYTCAVCAQVCEHCKQSCERFGQSDQLQLCADACQRCADSCHYMAQAAVAA